MRISAPARLLCFACAVIAATSHSVRAQQPAAQQQTGDKPVQRSSPPASSNNPFPEEQSRKAAQQPDATTSEQAPAPVSSPDHPSAAQDNPFPEEVSRKAAAGASHDATPSGMSSSSTSDPDLDGEPDRRRLPKPSKNVEPGSLSGVARAKQDIQVGNYYLSSNNWKGAYARFQEATRDDPTSADAVYGLAEAARHLGREDEAVANYKLYLEVLPDGPKAKPARKALETLSARK